MRTAGRGNGTDTYLITGVLGFIGSRLARTLLSRGARVVGIDNRSSMGTPAETLDRRLSSLKPHAGFLYCDADVADRDAMDRIFGGRRPALCFHLAAQTGVVCPEAAHAGYVHSNIHGFNAVLDCCRRRGIPLVYASSSSVYGAAVRIPFSEDESNLRPRGLYARTKLENERMAALYRDFLGFPSVGLRFFSVYGEDMRPDMAIGRFIGHIRRGEEFALYGTEETARDFTYVGDVVQAVLLLAERVLRREPTAAVYNVGARTAVPVIRVVRLLEVLLARKARFTRQPLRPEEMRTTCADTRLLQRHIGYSPRTGIEEGLRRMLPR